MKQGNYIALLGFVFLFLNGCAKQPKDFFSFEEDQESKADVARFQFPSVTSLAIYNEKDRAILSWKGLMHSDCIGYAIYRFYRNGFISNKPRAFVEKYVHTWVDEKPSSQSVHYIVRSIFKVHNVTVEGPSSALVGRYITTT